MTRAMDNMLINFNVLIQTTNNIIMLNLYAYIIIKKRHRVGVDVKIV